MSQIEDLLLLQIRASNLPEPDREVRFHPTRKWRFDFAYPSVKLAIEVEGGTWTGGRHTRGKGYEADCEKYNQAQVMGWRVLRFTGSMIESGAALDTLTRMLKGEQAA